MKTNLKWIEQEWNRWIAEESNALGVPIQRVLDVDSKEHVAKLFAAFCIDRLRIESEVADQIG